MNETRVIPESLDLKGLHEKANGTVAAASAILRVPLLGDGLVHLHITCRLGKGLTSVRLILTPREAEDVIKMLDESVTLTGERHAPAGKT